MQTLFHFIYMLALVVWLGSIVFFSFFAAPAIFNGLERDKAGEIVGLIFPGYYRIGFVCSVLALAALLLVLQTVGDVKVPLLAGMTACVYFSGLVISPKAKAVKMRIKELRSGSKPAEAEALKPEFDKWHSISVKLNAAVLLLGMVLLWLTAAQLKLL